MDKMLRDYCLREIMLSGGDDDSIEITDRTIMIGIQSMVPMLVTGAYLNETEPGHWYLVVEVDLPDLPYCQWMEDYICFEVCYLERRRVQKNGSWRLKVL